MSKNQVATIRVWTGDIDRRKFTVAFEGERVYATRRAHIYPNGKRVPVPNSWELLFDKKFVTRGGRIYFPEYDLEPTAEGGTEGIQLYASVGYTRDGQEESMDGNVFTLLADFAPEANMYHIAGRYYSSIGELSSARDSANAS